MKTLMHMFLTVLLLSLPLTSFAQDAAKVEEQKKIESRFQRVTYSLDTIEDVTKDLEFLTEAAAAGITKRVMVEIHGRFAAAVDLTSQVLTSTALSDEKRADYLKQLNTKLGAAFLKVLRFQKEDGLEDPRLDDYADHPEIKEMMAKYNKISANQAEPRRQMQREIMKKLDELDAAGGPTRATERSLLARFLSGLARNSGRAGSEFLMDFRAVFTTRLSVEQKRIWTLLDRTHRDDLSQDVLVEIASLREAFLGGSSEDEMLTKTRNFWMKQVEKALRLRSERLTSQKVTTATYFGLALVGFLFPMVDIIGLMDGGWSENSLFGSSMIYLSGWTVIGSLKLGSYSGRTVKMLETVRDVLKDPKVVKESDITEMQKHGLWRRMMSKFGSKDIKCDILLKAEGSAQAG